MGTVNEAGEDGVSQGEGHGEFMTQILNAARDEDMEYICRLKADESEDALNRQDSNGRTILMLGARNGYALLVQFLINNYRVLINIQDVKGQTALMMAASHGHVVCIKCLLSTSDIDTKLIDNMGRTALILAAQNGHLECAKRLLLFSKVKKNNSDWEKERKLAFIQAVMNDHMDCVSYLWEAKVAQAIDQINAELVSAIVLAKRHSHIDFLDCLVRSRAPYNRMALFMTFIQRSGLWDKIEPFSWVGGLSNNDTQTFYISKQVYNLYRQLGENQETGETLSRCTGIMLLCTPMECIYCLCGTGEANTQIVMFKHCMDTVIALAVVNSHFDCVRRLLESGLLPSFKMRALALVMSVCKGNVDCLEYLLYFPTTDLDGVQTITINNLCLLASVYGNAECVKCLLNTGQVDANHRDEYENTAIMLSAWKSHVECMKCFLVTGQVDVNRHNRYEKNALMLLSEQGNVECMKCLLSAGQVDVNHYDSDGNTALMISAAQGHVECVKCLLDTEQANVNYARKDGNTAVTLSAWKGHGECLKCLLDTGQIVVNHQDRSGMTALALSAWEGHVGCVKCLLETGQADVNHQDIFKNTALTLSTAKGHVECVKCLLETGQADVNHHDGYGNTALTLAMRNGHVECGRCLLHNEQVDISLANANGITALKEAVVNQQPRCLMLLLQHIPHNYLMDDHIKTIFLENSAKLKKLLYIPHFLNAGLFAWNWYPEFPSRRQRFLTRELVISGCAPRQFDWEGNPSSPLHHAFMINDEGLVRYLIANLYLTSFDVENFQRDKILQRHVSLNGSENLKTLHRQIYSSPWRLEALSLMRISTMLRKERREDDMSEELIESLIEDFQRLLGFKNSIRWLCLHQWVCIEVDYILNGRGPIWLNDRNSFQAKCCNNFCKRLRLTRRSRERRYQRHAKPSLP